MMYDSKMAIAVKAKGRVLRESKSGENTTVFIPFGSEYSLLIKNMNSVRALVKVWIDGTDVTEGTSGLIVGPNSSFDLERYIKNGNLSAGNKFKFIERTAGVSAHRGNKIDDGLIRVEFEYERVTPVYHNPYQVLRSYVPPKPYNPNDYTLTSTYTSSIAKGEVHDGSATMDWLDNEMAREVKTSSGLADASMAASASYNASNSATSSAFLNQVDHSRTLRSKNASVSKTKSSMPRQENETGITVAGGRSDQSFSWGAWFPTDGVKHVMIMQVLGELEGKVVEAPVTVKHKPTCSSCGKVNKANAKFCSECGTGLELI